MSEIKQINTQDELQTITQQYLQGQDTNLNKTKIEQYMRTNLGRLNQACKDTKGETRNQKVEALNKFLELINQYPQDFFGSHGCDLITTVFKLTFYNKQNVFGQGEQGDTESQINQNVHLILSKIIQAPKSEEIHQKVLIALGEIMYGQQKQVSSKRICRIMLYLGILISQTQQINNGSKFMQGTLYSLGGLMKVEARNFLFTKQNLDSNLKVPAVIKDPNPSAEDILQQARRDLTSDDLKFFEHGFLDQLENFLLTVTSACTPISQYDLYIRYSNPNFMDETTHNERSDLASQINQIEKSHFVLLLMFDLLQFCFHYMINAISSQPQAKHGQTLQRNPNEQIKISEIEPLQFTYFIPNFERLITTVCHSIERLCPQTYLLLQFWHIKNAENPGQAEQKDLPFSQKDTYDRTDNFNVYGLAVFCALKMSSMFSGSKDFVKTFNFNVPVHHYFLYELLQPFASYLLESESETLKQLGMRLCEQFCCLIQHCISPKQICVYTRDDEAVLRFLFNYFNLCGQYPRPLSLPVVKILFNHHDCLQLFEYFFEKLQNQYNDKQMSMFITGVFKRYSGQYLEFLEKKFFPNVLGLADSDRYILERVDSVQAGLSLLKLNQKNLPHIVDGYLKQVRACTQAALTGVDDQADGVQLPSEVKQNQRRQLQDIQNTLEFFFS